MNWFQKTCQIPATNLPTQLWDHGTDTSSAYKLMRNMFIQPRRETGESSYTGSLSSIPDAVYLTLSPGKAAKHALERAESYKSHPVILVVPPENLGYTQVDEDFVHMLLSGNTYYEGDWYPSPKLEEEVFKLAAEYFQLNDWDWNTGQSDKALVLDYLEAKREGLYEDNDIEDEYLQEEGIVPDTGGIYEYDESMHAAKDIAKTLNDQHQREAIINFGSMAHAGKVQASEIYLIPEYLDRKSEGDTYTWKDSPTSLKDHEELRQFGTQIDPQQLLMQFMTTPPKVEAFIPNLNWLQKCSVSTTADPQRKSRCETYILDDYRYSSKQKPYSCLPLPPPRGIMEYE